MSDPEHVLQAVLNLEEFINEPPSYEDLKKVRDYRHELYPKWSLARKALIERAEYAEARAVRLHDELQRLLDRYKHMIRDTNSEPLFGEAVGVESAERCLFDNAPMADWEKHLEKPAAKVAR